MGELADSNPTPAECRRRAVNAVSEAPAAVAGVVWGLLAVAGELATIGRELASQGRDARRRR